MRLYVLILIPTIVALTIAHSSSSGLKTIAGLSERLAEFQNCNLEIVFNSLEAELEPLPSNFPALILSQNYKYDLGSEPSYVQQVLKHSASECNLKLHILIHDFLFLAQVSDHAKKELDAISDNYLKVEALSKMHSLGAVRLPKCADPCYHIFVQKKEGPTSREAELWTKIWLREQFSNAMPFEWIVSGDTGTNAPELVFSQNWFISPFSWQIIATGRHELGTLAPRMEMDQVAKKFRADMAWNFWARRWKYPFHKSEFLGKLPLKHQKAGSASKVDFLHFLEDIILDPANSSTYDSATLNDNEVGEGPISTSVIEQWDKHFNYDRLYVRIDVERGFNFATLHPEQGGSDWDTEGSFEVSPWGALAFLLLDTLGFDLLAHSVLATGLPRAFVLPEVLAALIEVAPTANFMFLIVTSEYRSLGMLYFVWLSSGFFLTNLYNAIITSYLTARWTPTLDVHYIHQLDNVTFVLPMRQDIDKYFCNKSKLHLYEGDNGTKDFYSPVCPSTIEPAPAAACFQHRFEFSDFGEIVYNTDREKYEKYAKRSFVFPSCWGEELLEYLKANPKSVYVTWADQIDSFIASARKNDSKLEFYKGKDDLRSNDSTFYQVSNIPQSPVPFRLQQLISSGIFSYFEYWLRFRATQEEINKSKVNDSALTYEPLSLESNIVYVFYVLAFAYFCISGVFLYEYWPILSQRLRVFGTRFRARFTRLAWPIWIYFNAIDLEPVFRVWNLVVMSIVRVACWQAAALVAQVVAAVSAALAIVLKHLRAAGTSLRQRISKFATTTWEYLRSIDPEPVVRFWNRILEAIDRLAWWETSPRVSQILNTTFIVARMLRSHVQTVATYLGERIAYFGRETREYVQSIDLEPVRRRWNRLRVAFRRLAWWRTTTPVIHIQVATTSNFRLTNYQSRRL